MKTEYGWRDDLGMDHWSDYDDSPYTLAGATDSASLPGYSLIAREVSEPRVVSIRG